MTNISFESLTERFETLKEEQRKLQEKFQNDSQALFKEAVKTFFQHNPGVNAIKWAQFTPYFNDGDTCYFNVYDISFTNATGDDLDEVSTWGEYEGDNPTIWVDSYIKNLEGKEGVDSKLCELIGDIIGSEDMTDVMLNMFGDHVSVTVTREGIDVVDHEHD
jgi:hypothetical protein